MARSTAATKGELGRRTVILSEDKPSDNAPDDDSILNQYFNGEDGRPEWNRISFTYNTTPTAAYT